ncbi:hypothetical protein E5676_scaffold139G00970 [Cucumis melo var. makuwa]|uniref:Uncharacterized protein n=2 Tax=Cucumis melo TaxID=3656 RepID=A0A5D3CHZ5_CUCMM|nr:hypothetical protein E6C27_scaffold344G00960 [Cucumis melo var. makuwa]TYK11441.1 hypothetical protein E5676_scaffold139G00970 [Cucumis melo var. makuwa]
MAEKKSPMASRLKKALIKLTAVVRLCLVPRRRSQRLGSFDSDDRKVGIRIVLEDQSRIAENSFARKLERASSSRYGGYEEDVDQRAEIFIENFRRQLRLERQISLQLRYYRVNSYETEYEQISPPSIS